MVAVVKTFRTVITLLGEVAFFALVFPLAILLLTWFHVSQIVARSTSSLNPDERAR